MLGLNGREQNYPSQLSGGQQQRVAIARALINEPAILLADEPTGNLDSTNSAEILEMMTRLNRERGLTIIIVTHDAEVAAYTDRIITFRDGVIVSDTPTSRAGDHQRAAATTIAHEAQAAVSENETRLTFGMMALTAAARAINRNKLRAALTMLGIFIGVAAVIAMVAVGNGARYSVQQQIQSLGTNLLVILPGAQTSTEFARGPAVLHPARGGCGSDRKQVAGTVAVSYMDRQVGRWCTASELEHEYRRHDSGLPGYSRLAGDRGAAFTDEEDAERGAGVPDRADGS